MEKNNIRRPLWIKIAACGFAVVLFASVAIGGMGLYSQSGMSDDALNTKVESDLSLIQANMSALEQSAAAIAGQMAADPESVDIVTNNGRQRSIDKYGPGMSVLAKQGGLTFLTFADAKGNAIARIHAPDKFGDDMTQRRKTVSAALSTGQIVSGIEPGRDGSIGIYAVAPVIRDGKVIGAVDIGTRLAKTYFDPIAEKLNGEIAVDIMVDGKLKTQSSTNGDQSLLSPADIQAGYDGETVFKEVDVDNRTLMVKVVPVTNFAGEKIGVIEVGANATDVMTAGSAALRNMVIGTIIASLVSLLVFLLFARSLAGAIARLTATMTRLASGDLNATVEGSQRPDEIGAMAAAVQVFKDNAIRTRELEQEADAQRNMTEDQRMRLAEQERARAEAMAQATQGLAGGLKQLASGNLSTCLDQPFAEDFESLRADFNVATEQLRHTLGSVAEATGSIDSGSREVSRSADDLAKRTEQQAASLEETAAALDEITANVANSSKRAEEARNVAIQANTSARHSGSVVANAVDAMGRIEQSSEQISSIIGVIDDIAFQTNLLALNAGVEAARAGEAGKGFAVVAQEVRELAQRSARAAKEIKDLISKSSIEVDTGVRLVSETGDALKTIETYIVTINQHMDAMATSSREQSLGLSEVNTAVNQMDQVTQQNAAMVEEANAAGATLAQEAGRLRELIAGFQLGNVASFESAALRGTASIMAASSRSTPAASPARNMVGKIAKAFGGRGAATAAATAQDSWEEF